MPTGEILDLAGFDGGQETTVSEEICANVNFVVNAVMGLEKTVTTIQKGLEDVDRKLDGIYNSRKHETNPLLLNNELMNEVEMPSNPIYPSSELPSHSNVPQTTHSNSIPQPSTGPLATYYYYRRNGLLPKRQYLKPVRG